MKKPDIKLILAYSWPFIGLIIFFIWTWFYIKPMLPEDFFSWEKFGEKISGIFTKEEEWTHPDEKYDFHYVQDKLKPKTEAELGLKEKFLSDDFHIDKEAKIISVVSEADFADALTDLQGGEVIKLGAGNFRVNLEIEKNIIILGQGTSTVLSALDQEKAIISASKNSLIIKNFEIRNGRIGFEAEKANVKVENVKFKNLSASACYALDSKLNFKDSYIYNSGSAIKAVNSSGEITESIIKNNKKAGLDLRSSNFKIFNNIITGNQSYGIYADQGSKAEIFGNFIDDNKGFQVRIEGEREIYR